MESAYPSLPVLQRVRLKILPTARNQQLSVLTGSAPPARSRFHRHALGMRVRLHGVRRTQGSNPAPASTRARGRTNVQVTSKSSDPIAASLVGKQFPHSLCCAGLEMSFP